MPRMTIGQAFSWLAANDPHRMAVRDDATELSRIDLERRSNQLARLYLALGVSPNSLVAVSLPNGVDFVLACVAIWKAGATPMPFSPRLGWDEQEALLDLARPSLAVVSSRLGDQSIPTIGPDPSLGGYADSPLPEAAATSWKAPTTSGSTGRPKIVKATAGAWIDPEAQVAPFIPRDAVQLVAGPLYHSAPFTYAFRGLMSGHSLVIHPRFNERRVLAEISNGGITWAMLVPTMMHRIMRLPVDFRREADLSSLESILHLGAPCAPALKRRWLEWLGPERVTEVYAGTESQGLTAISGTEWLEHPGSVGRPISGSSMKVVDADGKEVPPGTVGEILMTRPGAPTYQYLGAPSKRCGTWDSLGDLGFRDEEGYFYVVDRLDDMIISGGSNIYPAEIEHALEQHPNVRSAAAFGITDKDLGQAVAAIADTYSVTSGEELLHWLRGRLDPEKIPRKIAVVNEPLRDDAGKVRRAALAGLEDRQRT